MHTHSLAVDVMVDPFDDVEVNWSEVDLCEHNAHDCFLCEVGA